MGTLRTMHFVLSNMYTRINILVLYICGTLDTLSGFRVQNYAELCVLLISSYEISVVVVVKALYIDM